MPVAIIPDDYSVLGDVSWRCDTNETCTVPLSMSSVEPSSCWAGSSSAPLSPMSSFSPSSSSSARRRVSQLGSFPPMDTDLYMAQSALAMLESKVADVEEVLSAMRTLTHDYLVQKRCCQRLWILSWDDEATVGQLGGIALVLDAMRRFPLDETLQHFACESLCNLALCHRNAMDMGHRGAVETLVRAMRAHAQSAAVQRSACVALANLASHGMMLGDLLAIEGLNVLMQAREHSHRGVQRAAREALASFGLDPLHVPRCPTPTGM